MNNKFHIRDLVTDGTFEMKVANVYKDEISGIYLYECFPTKFAIVDTPIGRLIPENQLRLIKQGETLK